MTPTLVRVGSDVSRTLKTPSPDANLTSVTPCDAAVGYAHSTSDSHCNRDLFGIALTLSNIPTPDVPLMHTIHDLISARGAEAFVTLIGSPIPISRAALHNLLVTDFGGRALAIGVKWREEDPLQITGLVTCGPASLGQHWRLSAVFSAAHKVPLTLNVMQLCVRLWFATLGRQWPRSVSWRTARGSVEGRRILETLLVFHAKKPGTRRAELWASISATGDDHELAPTEVQLGAGPFGAELLEDLATWGVGTAHWAIEALPSLAAVSALPDSWMGYVLHCAELPMSCRGFQHLTPMDREALLGQPIAEMLNTIAVTQRAAMAKLRTFDSTATAAAAAPVPPIVVPRANMEATTADASSDAAWKSLIGSQMVSPQAKPAIPPTTLLHAEASLDDDAWRSVFSTKSVTPALSPRFVQPHDFSILRQ